MCVPLVRFPFSGPVNKDRRRRASRARTPRIAQSPRTASSAVPHIACLPSRMRRASITRRLHLSPRCRCRLARLFRASSSLCSRLSSSAWPHPEVRDQRQGGPPGVGRRGNGSGSGRGAGEAWADGGDGAGETWADGGAAAQQDCMLFSCIICY